MSPSAPTSTNAPKSRTAVTVPRRIDPTVSGFDGLLRDLGGLAVEGGPGARRRCSGRRRALRSPRRRASARRAGCDRPPASGRSATSGRRRGVRRCLRRAPFGDAGDLPSIATLAARASARATSPVAAKNDEAAAQSLRPPRRPARRWCPPPSPRAFKWARGLGGGLDERLALAVELDEDGVLPHEDHGPFRAALRCPGERLPHGRLFEQEANESDRSSDMAGGGLARTATRRRQGVLPPAPTRADRGFDENAPPVDAPPPRCAVGGCTCPWRSGRLPKRTPTWSSWPLSRARIERHKERSRH